MYSEIICYVTKWNTSRGIVLIETFSANILTSLAHLQALSMQTKLQNEILKPLFVQNTTSTILNSSRLIKI